MGQMSIFHVKRVEKCNEMDYNFFEFFVIESHNPREKTMTIAESILRFLQQPVLVLDETLRPVIANPAFFQLFDLSPADLEGEFITELIGGQICEPSLRMFFWIRHRE